MTSSNGDNQDDQKQWEAVLSGRRLPMEHSRSQQEADALRQVLIWRNAKQIKAPHTSEDAAEFYNDLQEIQKQRKRASYLRWLKIGLAIVAFLSLIGFGLWYMFGDKSTFSSPHSSLTQPSEQATNLANQETLDKSLSLIPELVLIPVGSFTMGCSVGWDDSEGDCHTNEFPPYTVDIKSFRLARYEVTLGQFKHFVNEAYYLTTAEQNKQGCSVVDPENPGAWITNPNLNWRNPGFAQTDSHPVVCISWKDTQAYLTWLSKKTRNQYRLPNEAEWEYAARAGRVTAFYWGSKGDRRFANYQGVAANDSWPNTAPVGRYPSNDFGLHDMSGNVWEWTASCWRESYQTPEISSESCEEKSAHRAKRGGSWGNNPPSIRSAYRSSGSEVERSYLYGFRIAHDY